MFCPECGKEIADQSAFCGYCGSSTKENLESTDAPSYITHENEKKQGKKPIVIGLCTVGAVVLCLALYFLFPAINEIVTNNAINSTDVSTSAENEILINQNDNNQDKLEEQNSDKLISSMSDAEKRGLNIFFSNFSEALFDYYNPDEVMLDRNYFLVGFAFTHNSINNNDKIIWQDDKMGILATDVNNTLERFFGLKVPLESCSTTHGHEWTYEDNVFWSPAGTGESHDYFSIVTDMKDIGDGTYIAHYNTYYAGYGELTTDHYTYSVEQANNTCEFLYQVTAHVKPKVYNNKNTYEVISLIHE